jgi:RHS repeat-associated protein
MADDFRHRFSTKAFEAAGDSALPALYYYGYRYYAPRHGRRLSRDPIGEEGGLLLYGFCGNGPLGAVDPLGLDVLVISNGPKPGNPFGHTAIALTGRGVFSYGNGRRGHNVLRNAAGGPPDRRRSLRGDPFPTHT